MDTIQTLAGSYCFHDYWRDLLGFGHWLYYRGDEWPGTALETHLIMLELTLLVFTIGVVFRMV